MRCDVNYMTSLRSDRSERYRPRVLRPGMAPIPRCCADHPDWPTLLEHLLNDFPNATISQVVREGRLAREQVDHLGFAESDARLIAELIMRRRLLGLDPDPVQAVAVELPD